MDHFSDKRVFLLLLSLLILFSPQYLFAGNFQAGNYPRFAYAQLFTTGEKVSEKPNTIMKAIESGDAIALRAGNEFNSLKHLLFPEKYYGNSYQVDKLSSPTFIRVMSDIVENFACAEYRFRKQMPETTQCGGYVIDKNKREGMPFVSGQYKTSRIEANRDDIKNHISFNAFLSSTEERGLDSAFGSVHELGTFFGRLADRESLILSVNVQAYQLDSNHLRSTLINSKPLIYFLILPKATDIAKQPNEKSAAKFTVKSTRMLVLQL